jgi:hypothetical protein
MLRQSLDADSAYADASLHGDRITAIQARTEKGGLTSDVPRSAKLQNAPGRTSTKKLNLKICQYRS